MIERIKALFPFILILVSVGALINVGAIPGKEPILRFLGLSNNALPEEARPLDYVPGRLLELQPSSGVEITSYPSPSSSPSPLIRVSSPSPYQPEQPPPPPPFVLGANMDQEPSIPPDFSNLVGISVQEIKDESVWQTIKGYFGDFFK